MMVWFFRISIYAKCGARELGIILPLVIPQPTLSHQLLTLIAMHFAIPDPQSMEASTTITAFVHGSILERVTSRTQ